MQTQKNKLNERKISDRKSKLRRKLNGHLKLLKRQYILSFDEEKKKELKIRITKLAKKIESI